MSWFISLKKLTPQKPSFGSVLAKRADMKTKHETNHIKNRAFLSSHNMKTTNKHHRRSFLIHLIPPKTILLWLEKPKVKHKSNIVLSTAGSWNHTYYSETKFSSALKNHINAPFLCSSQPTPAAKKRQDKYRRLRGEQNRSRRQENGQLNQIPSDISCKRSQDVSFMRIQIAVNDKESQISNWLLA